MGSSDTGQDRSHRLPAEYLVYEIVAGTPTLARQPQPTTAATATQRSFDGNRPDGERANDWFIVVVDRNASGWEYYAANNDLEAATTRSGGSTADTHSSRPTR